MKFNKNDIAAFHRRLHRWYDANGRKNLPWRNTGDAYAIYVSEIMLQQTQVKTVLGRYYFPFLERFPTLSALAAAKRQDVLKTWQGLGYYNRAINLHETAKRCRKALPHTVEALQALPGIGPNTARAVAAFAYRRPVPVAEANVRRVLARMFALEALPETLLWDKAGELLDAARPFDYNQAMMDLGALVCSPRAPDCARCPAGKICLGKSSPESYPAPKKKKAAPVRRKAILVLRNRAGHYFASPRKGKFLSGLYHFTEQAHKPESAALLGHIRQQYSHFTLDAEVYLKAASGGGRHWHNREQLAALPFSAAERKVLELLRAKP